MNHDESIMVFVSTNLWSPLHGDTMTVKLQQIQYNRTDPNFPKNPPKPFLFYSQKRMEKGMTKAQIATELGYRNLTKGCRRITEWESTRAFPSITIKNRYHEILDIQKEELLEGIRQYQLQIPYQYSLTSPNIDLLAQYHHCLLQNAETIIQNPQFHQCKLEGIQLFVAFSGTCHLTLGGLIRTWSQGDFQTASHYLLHGGGSPLSGSHILYGFTKTAPHTYEKMGHVFSPFIDGIRSIMVNVDKSKLDSAWSLPQILAHLNIAVPNSSIMVEGEAIAEYNFQSKTLEFHSSMDGSIATKLQSPIKIDCSDEFPEPHEQPQYHPDATFSRWRICRQNIQRDNLPILHWNFDLPIIVSQKLIQSIESGKLKSIGLY